MSRKESKRPVPINHVPEYTPEWNVTSAAEVEPMTHIIEHIFVGGARDVTHTVLTENSITHVLCAAKEITSEVPQHVTLHHIRIDDRADETIESHFDEAIQFMNTAANSSGRVLVHCRKGISRSPSLVLAYLIKEKGMSYEEALQYVKERRKTVAPNMGFVEKLRGIDTSMTVSSSDGALSDSELDLVRPPAAPLGRRPVAGPSFEEF
eukprot:PhF_6_TR22759/c1_g1_i1/m.32448/K04459/DUSP, MKP; dual specificity MAP kinase phosphatase